MKSTLKLLPSLLVTIVMSSLAPVMICGLVLAVCSLLLLCPGVTASILRDGLKEFLQVFGNGNAVEGILTIAITCGFVGGIFETFNFYYYQNNS
ncbi:hypothetical protein Lepto7376_0231 [[Leptolyngbya] sp. PCC 7376]|uniref:hypothetical protein n=1 Tax=[Leptolyngbya] sp. PCC 7376 TaxID=111781 RepID=UPI00029F1737|nr:hypothetical protein [[Leptolyngbya] sp. PCC 7376]AFY36675.1 hypothetical protein Lepto7376_0231 [[Leptolyngbya] sp. PCC 7376]